MRCNYGAESEHFVYIQKSNKKGFFSRRLVICFSKGWYTSVQFGLQFPLQKCF